MVRFAAEVDSKYFARNTYEACACNDRLMEYIVGCDIEHHFTLHTRLLVEIFINGV